MKAHRLKTILALAVVGATAAFGGSLLALEGGDDDPSGDTSPAGGALDIVSFTHDNTADDVVYTLTTAQGWTGADDLTEIVWTLDFTPEDANDDEDACVEVTPASPAGVEGAFFAPCSAASPEATTVTTTHTDGEELLEVEFERAALDDANGGTELASYSYRITAQDDAAAADSAPDAAEEPATHDLAQAASPSPTPTTEPSAEPTEEPAAESDELVTAEPSAAAAAESAGQPQLPATGFGVTQVLAGGLAFLATGLCLRSLRKRLIAGERPGVAEHDSDG